MVGGKQADLDTVEIRLLGRGGDTEAGIDHAPVRPGRVGMCRNLCLNTGYERIVDLPRSAEAGRSESCKFAGQPLREMV